MELGGERHGERQRAAVERWAEVERASERVADGNDARTTARAAGQAGRRPPSLYFISSTLHGGRHDEVGCPDLLRLSRLG